MFYPEHHSRRVKTLFPSSPDVHQAMDWGHVGVVPEQLNSLASERAYVVDAHTLALRLGAEIDMTPEERAIILSVAQRFSEREKLILEVAAQQSNLEKDVLVRTPRSARITPQLVQ